MGWLGRRDTYDRNRLLDQAARARARGRRRRAIALYRRVLAQEPENAEIHHKLAPLLAETRQAFDAWWHYRTAARAFVREDRLDKASAVYREASGKLPQRIEVWAEWAELERRRGRRGEALRVLLDGRIALRRRRHRAEAIHLLRRAHRLDPHRLDVVVDLARLLARADQAAEALALLERTEASLSGAALRSLRAARFRITLGVGDLWRWLRTPASRQGLAALAPGDGA